MQMQQTIARSSCWISYICGVKQIIEITKQWNPTHNSDMSLMLGWVYYFDIMARFTIRHWRTEQIEAAAKNLGFNSQGERSCVIQYILARDSFAKGVPDLAAHSHSIMQLLAGVSDIAIYSSEPRYATADYQRHLDDLRLRLEAEVIFDSDKIHSTESDSTSQDQQLLQLICLAALIYLERVSRNFSGQSAKIDLWTHQGFSILTKLDSCLCPFALFILGCEANKDEDRIIILSLYSRMENQPYLRSFMESRSLIQTAWNQQDLSQEGILEYIHKLNLVVSSRDRIPSFI
jgi:hypothetical protein